MLDAISMPDVKPESELVEAKVEAEALGQVYQQACSNLHTQIHQLDIQKQVVSEAQKHKDNIQMLFRKAFVRLKAATEAEQRKQHIGRLS